MNRSVQKLEAVKTTTSPVKTTTVSVKNVSMMPAISKGQNVDIKGNGLSNGLKYK